MSVEEFRAGLDQLRMCFLRETCDLLGRLWQELGEPAWEILAEAVFDNNSLTVAAAVVIREHRELALARIPACEEALRSPDTDVRLTAIQDLYALSRAGNLEGTVRVKIALKPAAAAARPAVFDVDSSVRAWAIKTLVEGPVLEEEVLDLLPDLLSDDSENVLGWACRLAAVFGSRARGISPILQRLTRHFHPRVRECAVWALEWVEGRESNRTHGPTCRCDICLSPPVPKSATQRESSACLIEALDDDDAMVRLGAAAALARFEEDAPAATPRLLALLSDPDDERVCGAAFQTLCDFGDPEIRRQAILTALAICNDTLQYDLCEIMERHDLESAEVIVALLKALDRPLSKRARERFDVLLAGIVSQDPNVRGMFVRRLANPRDPSLQRLVTLLAARESEDQLLDQALARCAAHSKRGVRAAVCQVLPRLSCADRASLFETLWADHEAEVRRSAMKILSDPRLAAPEILPWLLRGLCDAEPSVRIHAAEVLGERGITAPEVVPALRPLWSANEISVRLAGLDALATIPGAAVEAWPALLDLLADPQPQVRLRAVRMIEAAGPQPGLDPQRLAPLLRDDDAEIQARTVFTLCKFQVEPDVVLPHLMNFWSEIKGPFRREAESWLARLGPPVIAILRPDLLSAELSKVERAMEVLSQMHSFSTAAVATLVWGLERLDPKQLRLQAIAIRCLEHLHPDPAAVIPALTKIVETAPKDSLPHSRAQRLLGLLRKKSSE